MTFPTATRPCHGIVADVALRFNAREGLVTFPTPGARVDHSSRIARCFNAREGLVTFPTSFPAPT